MLLTLMSMNTLISNEGRKPTDEHTVTNPFISPRKHRQLIIVSWLLSESQSEFHNLNIQRHQDKILHDINGTKKWDLPLDSLSYGVGRRCQLTSMCGLRRLLGSLGLKFPTYKTSGSKWFDTVPAPGGTISSPLTRGSFLLLEAHYVSLKWLCPSLTLQV